MSTYTTTFKYRRALEMGPLYLKGVIIGYLNKNKPRTKSPSPQTMFSQFITYYKVKQAVRAGNIQLVEEYVEQGFDLNITHMKMGYDYFPMPWTWNHLVFSAKSPPMIRMMVGHGANINARDQNGRTVLHDALFERGHESAEVVRTLIRMGVDPSIAAYTVGTAIDEVTARMEAIRNWGGEEWPNMTNRLVALQHNMDACTDETHRIDTSIAFAMGLQERLGEGSRVSMLDPDLLHMILSRF
jgi:hypothetical protein